MDSDTSEQALRREAIRRRLEGEGRNVICRELGRSTSWFDKWWAIYRDDPQTDFAARSTAPQVSPSATPAHVVQAWVGEYVRATINTAEQSLSFWHQAVADADWYRIKTRRFALAETVHPLLPEFRRNRTRCRDY